MRGSILRAALFACLCFFAACAAQSQSLESENFAPPRLDLAVTYNPVVANVTTPSGFTMQGGSVQVQSKLWRRFSVVADFAGLHTGNVNNTGVPLDLITATFGPRYTWAPAHRRILFFGQALVGDAHALNGLFPSPTGIRSTGNSFALQVGGGINVPLSNHLSLRVFDAQWLRTSLPNGTTNVQNNLRLGAGIVYRFL